MQKSTKILLTVFSLLILALGGMFLMYMFSPLPEVKGDYKPHIAEKISYNAPLSIEFSNQMNQAVTEKSFRIAPAIEGVMSWENSFTLVFTPSEKFEIDQKIHVTILKTAQDFLGKNLIDDFEIDFIVVGAPKVVFVAPANQKELAMVKGEDVTEEMDKTRVILPYSPSPLAKENRPTKITVMFDRPMRELTTLDESDENQAIDFLQITPEIKGEYKWLGTQTIQFIPEELPMSTVFEVKIPEGVKSLDGGMTEEEYVWHFETEKPILLSSTPREGDQFFDPANPIKLHFNQQVNLDTLYQGLNFYPPKDGFFNGEIAYENGDLTTVLVTPKPALQHPENYTLSILKGIQGIFGTKATEEEIMIHFKTYDKAEITDYSPQDGAEDVKPYEIEFDFATPMIEDSVEKYITVTPEVENLDVRFEYNDTRAYVNGDFKPGEKYTVEMKKGARDTFDQILREGIKTSFTMADSEPYVSLLARGERGLFADNLPPEYYIRSINLKHVDFEICKIDQADFISTERDYGWYEYNCQNPDKWEIEIESPKNLYKTTTVELADKVEGKGIYFLRVSSPEYLRSWDNEPYSYRQLFFITDTALSFKYSEKEALVWANDMETGKPVEKMYIEIYDTNGQKILAKGYTDKDGIFKAAVNEEYGLYAFGSKDEQWGLVGGNWTDGIQSWDFGLQRGWYQDNRMFGYLYTDRPIYRLGHEVFFKGIMRAENDVKYSLPGNKEVKVKIEDSYGNNVFENNLPLNENGSFFASVKLAENAPTGSYYFSANIGDNYFSRRFTVEEYRKPEFKIDFEGEQTEFVNKERFNTEIAASYYFGGALQNAEVSWELMTDDYYFDEYEGEWYSFSANDYDYWGCYMWGECEQKQDAIASGEGHLDNEGKLKIEEPIDLSERDMSQLYTLTATVTDLNSQQVSYRQTFIVHKGDYYVGIKNRDYVGRTGEESHFDVITVDPKGDVISGKNVTVDFYKREWNSIQKEGVDGNFYWESENKDTLVTTENAKTDENGKVGVAFRPKEGGYYLAVVKSIDSRGNEIKAKASMYVSSNDYIGWGSQNHDRIDLVLDKKSYKIGETAEILVKSPFEKSVKALLTIERQKIMESKIITLNGNSEIIRLPITEDMLPNVFVSLLLFKGSGDEYKVILMQQELEAFALRLKESLEKVKELEEEEDEINVDIEKIIASFKDRGEDDYEDSARYKIRSSRLETVQKELEKLEKENNEILNLEEVKKEELKLLKKTFDSDVLAKIEAGQMTTIPRPEFKLGYANVFVETESKRLDLEIQTNKERYHAGDEVVIKLKTTDEQKKGQAAEVSIAVVDESLLALKSRNLEDLVSFFYGRRGLHITTAQSLVYFIERLNVKAQKGEKGGGGGDESLEQKKRGDFKDTAYWNPHVMTNMQGEAEVKFTLPDNLTTWQIWAVGATDETIVGSAEKDFMTTKDLIVRPVLPRFMTMKDKMQIGAIVHNQSLDTENVRVTLSGLGFVIEDDEMQKIELKANEEKKLMWEITVDEIENYDVNKKVTINLLAQSALYRDEVEQSLPLKTFSVPEFVATSSMTQDLAKEKIYLPESIDSNLGEVKVSVGPTLATNFAEGLEFLADFPYGCAEQTMSRHLPNVILKQLENLFAEKGLEKIIKDEAEFEKMISEGLQKLYQFQRYDGGWGYFVGSNQSYPYLSAYVLFGLHETQKAGYNIDEKVFEKGGVYVRQCLNNPEGCKPHPYYKLSTDDQAFALWVLSEISEGDLALSQKLFEEREDMSLFAKGYLIMAMLNLTQTQNAAAIQTDLQQKIGALKSEFETKAFVETRGVHFEEEEQNYWSMNSNTRTTAILLKALVKQDATNPLIPNIIEWLRIQKQDGHWATTQETVWSLLALNDYFVKSGELDANFNVKVSVNDEEKLNKNFDQTNLFTKEELVILVQDLTLGMPSNEILFKKEGEGNLYYDVTAKYYLPIEEIKERSEGMTIQRAYSVFGDEEEKIVKNPKIGDLLKGKLTMIVPEDRHFVMVEEFLPAGYEPINFNLETENQNLRQGLNDNRDDYYWWRDQTWRFYHREYRDDRVSLFADYLPAGVYEFEFLVRVTSAGTFHHLPAQISEMYYPEVFGRSRGEKVVVKD